MHRAQGKDTEPGKPGLAQEQTAQIRRQKKGGLSSYATAEVPKLAASAVAKCLS
jgi:hypothetical protein